jgi:predicted permease
MWSMIQDLRYGARLLWRAPAFTIVAVLSLALGIGGNAAIFGAIHGLLLKPTPAPAPDRLVAIFTSDFSGPRYGASSYADAVDFAEGAPALEGVAVSSLEGLSLTAGTQPERIFTELVSPNYFGVLGLRPAAGRLPAAALTDPMAPSLVLTHRYWQRRFGGDPAVVGRLVRIGREAATIVGVAPASYTGLNRILDLDAFVVAPFTPERAAARGNRGFEIVGRLRGGATREAAQAQLNAVAAALHESHPREWTDVASQPRRVTVAPERALRIPPDATGPVTAFLLMLALTVGLVLLVACANVAGLLIARAADRRQEVAVRLSLGATRGRLVRQLLVEAVLLAAIAAVAGLALAQWILVALERVQPPLPLPVRLDFAVDGPVLAATLALAALTALLFGIAPALQATRGLQHAGSPRGGPLPDRARRVPLRALLIVGQVAASAVLLVLAGLFVRALQAAGRSDVGFETAHVLVATLDPSMLDYGDERGAQLYDAILARVRTVPGVQSATVARVVPLALDFEGGRRRALPSNYQPQSGEDMEVHYNVVGPGYFATLRIRMAAGREFTDADRSGTEPVLIVNQAYAARYWPGKDPLGQRISVSGPDGPFARVVGVAANTKYTSRSEAPLPIVAMPFAQHYRPLAKLHVRTAADPAALAPAIRDAIRSIDPALPVLELSTLSQRTSASLLPQQIAASLIGAFGAVALLLSLLGLYGVLARGVAQRSREIGIRLALGAAPGSILRLVLAQGWRLTAIGLAVGLAVAAAGARLLAAFLPGIGTLDAPAFAGAVLVLAAGASLAMWLPARRALAVDPADALRTE